jgi:hypothetical protein
MTHVAFTTTRYGCLPPGLGVERASRGLVPLLHRALCARASADLARILFAALEQDTIQRCFACICICECHESSLLDRSKQSGGTKKCLCALQFERVMFGGVSSTPEFVLRCKNNCWCCVRGDYRGASAQVQAQKNRKRFWARVQF